MENLHLNEINSINYDDLKISQTINQCSGSSYIGRKDFGYKIYISNAYSKYSDNNNVMNLYYEIKIFEFSTHSSDFNNILNFYAGKSLKIEIINYSTTPPSDFDYITKANLDKLLNKERESLIKCRIINSFINNNLEEEIYYKEIIILCLYYSKDLVNSLNNEPKFSIRLDLFKNNIGSNELKFISYLNIKDSISIDSEDILYPSLIHFKSRNELYIILKGVKYSEIYSVKINSKTLELTLLNNKTEILLKSNNIEHISFSIREFIGSFYIVKYDSESKNINVMIYGDRNKNNYNDTIIQIDDDKIRNNIIKRIETSSISNVLLGILIVTDMKAFVVFIQYPMCDPLPKTYHFNSNIIINLNDLIPSDITISKYSKYFIPSNKIIDSISSINSPSSKINSSEVTIISNENNYLEIINSNEYNSLKLKGNNHKNNIELIYNLYYEDSNNNKYYSTTCSFFVDICYPFEDIDDCANKNDMPIENYYLDEENSKFKRCNTCKYCIGPSLNECIKCNNNEDYYLSESNLNKTIINSKIYEYSNCVVNCDDYYYYINDNFEDNSVKVCLDNSENCPEEFPYLYNNKICYKNCKNSGTDSIYGNLNECSDECINNYFFYENNTCVIDYVKCPENYYLFELEKYCTDKCINSLYHIKNEKKDVDDKIYFELNCQNTCPPNLLYYFIDDNNYKYCLSNCSSFSFYFNEFDIKYNIYYKNTLLCLSKSQCNQFFDEYGSIKYVAQIIEISSSGENITKRVCLSKCEEVGQLLLPNHLREEVDCTEECPNEYGNYSWVCMKCSDLPVSIYEYEKNCIDNCPLNSFQLVDNFYKCFSSCPSDYPYQDNYTCYKNLEDVPLHSEEFGEFCDKTKHLWYKTYNVNNLPIVKCLNDTDVYLTCYAVIPDYPYTNKANHECVKTCPDSYTTQNEHTKFCDLDTNKLIDFNEIRETLLTHELIDNITKNESNLIICERDYNSEKAISFYLFNYSNILEKVLNGIEPDVTIQETNGDIRKDEISPFYYQNGTEIIISDQCEDILRQAYYIPYYNVYNYIEDNITYINGIKYNFPVTKQYYVPQYLLGIIMNIKRDNTSQVEYKLYNPKNPSIELDLSLCHEVEDDKTNIVTINIERDLHLNVYNKFNEVYTFYSNNKEKYLDKYIYDIFNRKSDFFIDPCTPFTSKYESDVLIVDRYKDYYVRIDFCEKDCTYLESRKSYKNLDSTFIQISCQCPIKYNYNKENEISFGPIVDEDKDIDESQLTNKEKKKEGRRKNFRIYN